MRIIEIEPLPNGSHRNQAGNFKSIPDGWAVVPKNMECENFPFGEIEIEEVKGIMTVTKWIAGTIPKPTPMPEPEPTAEDKLNALVGGMSYE